MLTRYSEPLPHPCKPTLFHSLPLSVPTSHQQIVLQAGSEGHLLTLLLAYAEDQGHPMECIEDPKSFLEKHYQDGLVYNRFPEFPDSLPSADGGLYHVFERNGELCFRMDETTEEPPCLVLTPDLLNGVVESLFSCAYNGTQKGLRCLSCSTLAEHLQSYAHSCSTKQLQNALLYGTQANGMLSPERARFAARRLEALSYALEREQCKKVPK